MRSPVMVRLLRCAGWAVLAAGVILASARLPRIDHTILALALVLLILAISIRWGWAEALAASLSGGLGFDTYMPPPHGLALRSPQQLIALAAFLCAALATGWFSAGANRHRALAEERRLELARLGRLDDALPEGRDPEELFEVIAPLPRAFVRRATDSAPSTLPTG